jgi:shikimate-5-dehydrogenase
MQVEVASALDTKYQVYQVGHHYKSGPGFLLQISASRAIVLYLVSRDPRINQQQLNLRNMATMMADLAEAHDERSQIEQRNFWIFGQGISFSMSPTIHCAGFQHYNLPHTYEIHQTETVEELRSLVKSPAFGGASITMPHKLAITMYCSEVSEDAKIIGAVNTLIRDNTKEGRILGENTDWTGLASLLNDNAQTLSKKRLDTGLVIGAGGASRAALYALHKSRVTKIYLFNRSRSRAEEIAQDLQPYFEITVVGQLTDIPANEAPDVIIGTIPADKTTVELFPPVLFSQPEGVCIDMAYKPRFTPLMAATRKWGSQDWLTVPGVEVLLQQAFVQFEFWTGNPAPETAMRQALDAKDSAQVPAAKDGEKK